MKNPFRNGVKNERQELTCLTKINVAD